MRVAIENECQVLHARGQPNEARNLMIVCECTGTTDTQIRALARDGVTTVSEVANRCGAGGGCRSCRPYIARILRTAAKREATAEAVPAEQATA